VKVAAIRDVDRGHRERGLAAAYGTKFIGTEGSVFMENEKLVADPPALLRQDLKDGDTRLYVSNSHHRNFIDSVLCRADTAAPVEAAHRAASACHLGAIAAELALLQKALADQLAHFQANPEAEAKLLAVGHSPRDADLKAEELAAYANVARMLVNLSEFITKG